MFLDEARLSAHLSHSNVASVFDIGVGDDAYFIVMEYVDGADLKTVLEHYRKSSPGRAVPVEIAGFITARMCQGVAYAHELEVDGKPLGIIHRDITPANVLMTRFGEVKIVDFGLAKASSQLAESDAGVIKGKFGYLAPETVREQGVDQRVDIFALGILLWEMLAGRRLFLGDNDFATVRMVRDAVIPKLPVPAELDRILARALAREPTARYTSARELGRDLTRFLFHHGRAVSEDDVASLVRSALGGPQKSTDGLDMIADLIATTLLEFKSLGKESTGASASIMPDPITFPPPTSGEDIPLSGLADALEGPDPTATTSTEDSPVAAWLRGWMPRS
jgi:serine/threonine protein kinase